MSIMMNPRYIEREPIGQGAYGTVYKAVDDIDKKVGK